MRNYTLIGGVHKAPCAQVDIDSDRNHASVTMRGVMCPPVLYKGQTIPAGEIGQRGLR